MNFEHKKILIAPHTPRTTMFKKELEEKVDSVQVLGFIDKVKEGTEIFKLNDVSKIDFEYVLILSQNHFDSIYHEYKEVISKNKLIKVDIKNQEYLFFNQWDILRQKIEQLPSHFKQKCFQYLIRFYDKKERKKIVFLSKSFISTNNKALYTYCVEQKYDVMMITDNQEQLNELKQKKLPVQYLDTMSSYIVLSQAKIIIQDQGNSNYLLPYLSSKQKTVQLWHGIPLKRMNQLVGHVYDYYVGTSDYVNETSMGAVIQAKEYTNLGYPRNDLLLKTHSDLDLLFYDKNLYDLAQNEKVIVYMPTHRESSSSMASENLVPIDFGQLNKTMKELNTYFIIKFHPFVMQFYEDIKNSSQYSHILFHSIQGDIYPLLKYTDILITDYSSIYFDFLLLNKPIIFFDYDYEEYSSNMNGFVYDYNTCAPGKKVQTQKALENEIKNLNQNGDKYKEKRERVTKEFFDYEDEKSSLRIMDFLEEIDEE